MWLRFLSEIDENTKELIADKNIKEALELVQHSAFTDEELAQYDKFWDIIRTENTLMLSSEKKGRQEEKTAIAKNLKKYGMPLSDIAKMTGLPEEEINKL